MFINKNQYPQLPFRVLKGINSNYPLNTFDAILEAKLLQSLKNLRIGSSTIIRSALRLTYNSTAETFYSPFDVFTEFGHHNFLKVFDVRYGEYET